MKLLSLLLALSLCACGLKAEPRPKSSLNIAAPEFELSISESGVSIQNNMPNTLVVERAHSEVGDISAPDYDDIAIVSAGATFVDEGSEYGNRYIYRFRTYNDDYNAYSAPVTRIVSYRGVVKLESVSWTLNESSICLAAELSQSVNKVQVLINGDDLGEYQSGACYPLPAVSRIVLLMVPYSDSNTQGIAYSASIDRDLAQVLLPPQNIVILRRNEQITLSWDAIPNASAYKIYTDRGVIQTTSTLYPIPIGAAECTQLKLSTVRAGNESQAVELESCE